ncbi:hypothetical protein XENORESO_012779 [Xenotaenia resolanae]|uniref:Uncharacterized protein n=1 Tax=Xenotaenia resolanae TaxID=208358 RepID=A0ABV0VQN0_9TELE
MQHLPETSVMSFSGIMCFISRLGFNGLHDVFSRLAGFRTTAQIGALHCSCSGSAMDLSKSGRKPICMTNIIFQDICHLENPEKLLGQLLSSSSHCANLRMSSGLPVTQLIISEPPCVAVERKRVCRLSSVSMFSGA